MTREMIYRDDALECCDAIDIAALPAVQVTVKPLVWTDLREGGTCGRPQHIQYFVTQDRAGNFWTHFDNQKFGTLESARANCEAHWQRNMRVAAIQTQPTPVDSDKGDDPVVNDPRVRALVELLEVSQRAVSLSLKYDNFKLHAMAPMRDAI